MGAAAGVGGRWNGDSRSLARAPSQDRRSGRRQVSRRIPATVWPIFDTKRDAEEPVGAVRSARTPGRAARYGGEACGCRVRVVSSPAADFARRTAAIAAAAPSPVGRGAAAFERVEAASATETNHKPATGPRGSRSHARIARPRIRQGAVEHRDMPLDMPPLRSIGRQDEQPGSGSRAPTEPPADDLRSQSDLLVELAEGRLDGHQLCLDLDDEECARVRVPRGQVDGAPLAVFRVRQLGDDLPAPARERSRDRADERRMPFIEESGDDPAPPRDLEPRSGIQGIEDRSHGSQGRAVDLAALEG